MWEWKRRWKLRDGKTHESPFTGSISTGLSVCILLASEHYSVCLRTWDSWVGGRFYMLFSLSRYFLAILLAHASASVSCLAESPGQLQQLRNQMLWAISAPRTYSQGFVLLRQILLIKNSLPIANPQIWVAGLLQHVMLSKPIHEARFAHRRCPGSGIAGRIEISSIIRPPPPPPPLLRLLRQSRHPATTAATARTAASNIAFDASAHRYGISPPMFTNPAGCWFTTLP